MAIHFPIPIPRHFDFWSGPKVPVCHLGVAVVLKRNAERLANVMEATLRNSLDVFWIPAPTLRFGVSRNGRPLNHLSQHLTSDEDTVDAMSQISEHVAKLVWRVVTTEDSGRHHWMMHIPEPPERFLGPRTHSWPSAQRWVSPSRRTHGMLTTGPGGISQPITSANEVRGFPGNSPRLILQERARVSCSPD